MEKKDLKNKIEDGSKQVFGSALQALLKNSNVTKDAVAMHTRISRNYIEALCLGNVEQLPGRVFGRGFIQCITKMVKSDSTEILRLYDDCWTSLEPTKPNTSVPTYEHRSLRRVRFPLNKAIFIGACAAFLITVITFFTMRSSTQKKTTSIAPHTAARTADKPAQHPVESSASVPILESNLPEPAAIAVEPLKITSTDHSAALIPSTAGIGVIDFRVTEPVQIRLDVDGKPSDYRSFAVGEHKIEFNKSAELLIKDASSVEVNYNGKSLGELGKKGRMRRLVFKSSEN